MARLSASQRHRMPQSEYALSGKRFPINDAKHAHAALMDVGHAHISPAEKATVRRKAEEKLHHDGLRSSARKG